MANEHNNIPVHEQQFLLNSIVQSTTAQLNNTDITIKSEALEIVQTWSAQFFQSKTGQMSRNLY